MRLHLNPGNHDEGETPVPIPNTEAKPLGADGTARGAEWENRMLPGFLFSGDFPVEFRSGLCFGSALNQKLIPTGVGNIFHSAFKVAIVIDANNRAWVPQKKIPIANCLKRFLEISPCGFIGRLFPLLSGWNLPSTKYND